MAGIKNCPFCGGEANVDKYVGELDDGTWYRIQCNKNELHIMEVWFDTEKEAIETWNQRPYEPKKSHLEKQTYPNYGWICPVCGRGNSPLATTCGCQGFGAVTCGGGA